MLPCIRDDDEATLVLNTSEGLALAIILLRRAASASVARPMPSRSISKLTLKNMEVLALGIERSAWAPQGFVSVALTLRDT
jgi:hypothetical protein